MQYQSIETIALVLAAAHAIAHFPQDARTNCERAQAWLKQRDPLRQAWRWKVLFGALLALSGLVSIGPPFYYGYETIQRLGGSEPALSRSA